MRSHAISGVVAAAFLEWTAAAQTEPASPPQQPTKTVQEQDLFAKALDQALASAPRLESTSSVPTLSLPGGG